MLLKSLKTAVGELFASGSEELVRDTGKPLSCILVFCYGALPKECV